MKFCQNKITLSEIMKSVSCIKYNNKFINALFDPLKKEGAEYFLGKKRSGYIGKNTTVLMNGNYARETNERTSKCGLVVRQSTKMISDFSKRLQDSDVFGEMIQSVEKIADKEQLTRTHDVFTLIEKDADIMPEDFRNCLQNCLRCGRLYEALFFLILWSISGERIEEFSPIYGGFIQNVDTEDYIQKTARLLGNMKPCHSVFKGRDGLLMKMHEFFRNGGHFLFLQGIGGIGKSELAKHYAESYRSDYDIIVFAECEDSVMSAVNDDNKFSLTEPFVPQYENETEQKYYSRKINQLRKIRGRTLIILDNVDHFSKELETFLSVPSDIIITTRYEYSYNYPENTEKIARIDDKNILREIFLDYYNRAVDDISFVDRIIEMFEGHTMAVELVAKQARASCLTPCQMYDIIKNSEESGLVEPFHVCNYDSEQKNIVNHLTRLFNVSSLSEKEKYIMMCLSLIPITGMDKKIFRDCCGLSDFSLINGLVERSWARETEGYISVHALIQETVGITLRPDLIKCICFVMNMTKKFNLFYYKDYSVKTRISHMAEYIYKSFPEPAPGTYNFYEWLSLVFYYSNRNYSALEIAEKLLAIYLARNDNFRTARIIYRIGLISKHMNNIDMSLILFEKSKNILLKTENRTDTENLCISDINVALSNMILKRDLSDNTELCDRIEELSFETIEIRKNSVCNPNERTGPVFMHTVTPYRNLAWIQIYRKDYEKFYEYLGKAIAECESLNMKFETYVIDYVNFRMAQHRGDILSSIHYMEAAIEKYITCFGEDNIQVTVMLEELACICEKADNTRKSNECHEKITEILTRNGYFRSFDRIRAKIHGIYDKSIKFI